MSVMDDHTVTLTRTRRRRDQREFSWVLCITYPLFLTAAVVNRALSGKARSPRPAQSVFREAWITARSTIPFAFMN
jgi:hypothetical protein